MGDVTLCPLELKHAEALYKIFKNPGYPLQHRSTQTLKQYKLGIARQISHEKQGKELNFIILYQGKPAGRCGIAIKRGTGRMGYFVARELWGKGIATQALKQLEAKGFSKGLDPMWLTMDVNNKASERVAIKNNYARKGLSKSIYGGRMGFEDHYIYFKAKSWLRGLIFRLIPIQLIK